MHGNRVKGNLAVTWGKGSCSNLLIGVLVFDILLVLTVPVVPTQGSHTVVLPASHGLKTATTVTASKTTSARTLPGAASVAYTLDLCTNNLTSGNTLPVDCNGVAPWGLAYDSGKGEVFVTDYGTNNVTVLSDTSNKVVATIPVGSNPWGVAYDSGKGEVFVTNSGSYTVSVISDVSNTVITSIRVGSNPYGVAYDSGKGEVFVANFGMNTVSVISDMSNKVVATIPVGSNPLGVEYDSGKGEVFVTNHGTNNVSVISDVSNTPTASIRVGSNPYGVEYESGKGEVFVTNWNSHNVSVILDGTNTVVASIPIGSNPAGMAYDSGNGEVFVANWNSHNVSVILLASDTETSTVTVGSEPGYAVRDISNGYVYVSNYGQGTISLIAPGTAPPTYPVTFLESGLPAGTSWSMTLDTQTLSSTTSTNTFSEPNGTAQYTIWTVRAVTNYTPTPSSGNVVVNGTSKTVAITFTPYTSNSNQDHGFLGLPGNWGYVLVGVIAIATVTVIVLAYHAGSSEKSGQGGSWLTGVRRSGTPDHDRSPEPTKEKTGDLDNRRPP